MKNNCFLKKISQKPLVYNRINWTSKSLVSTKSGLLRLNSDVLHTSQWLFPKSQVCLFSWSTDRLCTSQEYPWHSGFLCALVFVVIVIVYELYYFSFSLMCFSIILNYKSFENILNKNTPLRIPPKEVL